MTRNHNLHNRGGVWYLRATIRGGAFWRSLRTGDIKTARKKRDSMLLQLTGQTEPDTDLKLSEAFKRFKGSLYACEQSLGSLQGAERVYKALCEWLPGHVATLRGVDGYAYRYAEELTGQGIADGTYNGTVGKLAHIWGVIGRDCVARGQQIPFDRNPWESIPKRKGAKSVGRLPFSVEHVRKLICIAPDNEWKSAIYCAWYTGLRRADVMLLRCECVDLDRGVIKVVPVKTARSGREAVIGMHPSLVRDMAARKLTGGFVFPELARLYQSKPWVVTRTFQGFCGDIGLKTKVDVGTVKSRARYGFHSFRHAFRTNLLSAGVEETLVSIMMGHSLGSVKGTYTHSDRLVGRLVEAAGVLPEIESRERVVAFKMAS